MAYKFTNQTTGKASITDETNTNISLAGVNTQDSVTADVIMSGLTTMLGIVGWTIADASRIVTQDIEETA